MGVFTEYNTDLNTPSDLVNAILGNSAGIAVDFASIHFVGSGGQVSFYDGSLAPLGIGQGILLTSGDGTPETTNTATNYGSTVGMGGDSDLDAALQAAGMGAGTQDATYLEFSFTVTDPSIKSITFDLVFGSEEYPEYADDIVDIAGVFVNGTNSSLFNNDPSRPLSFLQKNIDDGYFLDNQGGSYPIEYDGISVPLSIVAPVNQGVNTIKIAIADTSDSILDSGLFISNLKGSTQTGGGIVVPGNKTPVAADDQVSVREDRFSLEAKTVTGNVLSNDSDPNAGDSLFVSAVAGAAASVGQTLQGKYGTLTLRSDGSYTYSLANTDALIRGEQGVERFTYTVSDGAGGTDTARLEIRVVGEDLELTRSGRFTAHRGADRITGGTSADHFAGRAGDDILSGEGGDDILWGEAGDDQLLGADGSDQAVGGAGDDAIRLGAGDDRGWGEAGTDILHGEDGDDVIDGGDGNDRALLGSGNDKGFGGRGDDRLIGDLGADQLIGGEGDDTAEGGIGNDKLWGGDGTDTLRGGGGSDQFNGGADADLIYLDVGNDTAWGGGGDDRFIFTRGFGVDRIKDFQTGDQIVLEGIFRSFAEVKKYMKEVGDDIVIDVPGRGNVITIENVSRLGERDFEF